MTRKALLSLVLAGAGLSTLWPVNSAEAQISIGVSIPSVNIGINVTQYPELVLVPGYPVYYDPRADSNYFFFDGQYWVYQGDSWYVSSWYNGPWQLVGPEYVPLFVLRIPVRYYRHPPAYFRGWRADAPPRWGEHWGQGWESRRSGWDRWDRGTSPPAAPLPVYQRQYSGERYPHAVEQQRAIRPTNTGYQTREPVTQQPRQQPRSTVSTRVEPQQHAPVQSRAIPAQQQPQAAQPRAAPAQQQPQAAQPRAAPAQQQPQAGPQRPESRPAQSETRAAPRDNGRGNKAAPHDNGREKKNEEHGHDR